MKTIPQFPRLRHVQENYSLEDSRNLVDKFSGKDGNDDFEVADYKEAIADRGWTDEQRACWFSWFLSSPAKATWQQSLKDTDKASWERIGEIYCEQYGIHLDPHAAYQLCQELRYEQFG